MTEKLQQRGIKSAAAFAYYKLLTSNSIYTIRTGQLHHLAS